MEKNILEELGKKIELEKSIQNCSPMIQEAFKKSQKMSRFYLSELFKVQKERDKLKEKNTYLILLLDKFLKK